jgi:hypothetical protein
MGVELNIQSYREVSIAMSRKYLSWGHEFERDEDDDEEEDKNDAVDLQAAHTTSVAGGIYARNIQERSGEVESIRKKFRRVSEEWHRFLGFKEATAATSRRRKRAPFEDEMDVLRFERWKKLRRMGAEAELERMMGEGKRFRGIQKEAIEAVIENRSPVVAVMGRKEFDLYATGVDEQRRNERGDCTTDWIEAGHEEEVPRAGDPVRGMEQPAAARRGENCFGNAGGCIRGCIPDVFEPDKFDAAAGSDRGGRVPRGVE